MEVKKKIGKKKWEKKFEIINREKRTWKTWDSARGRRRIVLIKFDWKPQRLVWFIYKYFIFLDLDFVIPPHPPPSPSLLLFFYFLLFFLFSLFPFSFSSIFDSIHSSLFACRVLLSFSIFLFNSEKDDTEKGRR